MFSNFYICHQKRTTMKHGIYILTILMALLSLPESGYASIPFFAVANDTIRQVVIYFDANEAKVDLSYKDNNQVITILDSFASRKFEYEIYNSAECGNFLFLLMVMNLIIEVWLLGEMIR